MAISQAVSSQRNAVGAGDMPELKPWSPRRTVAFVLVVCGAFWITVGMAVAWLVRAL